MKKFNIKKLNEKIKKLVILDNSIFARESENKDKENILIVNSKIIFIFIGLFFLFFNYILLFGINFFYIREIISILFLLFIPGLLILLSLKFKYKNFWEYISYIIGLSISFIMFIGAFINWILPLLFITNKPISLIPILVIFNIILIILYFFAFYKNKNLEALEILIPKFTIIDNIFFIVPLTFPFIAILGAFILNNHGDNILPKLLLLFISLYIFLIVFFKNKLNKNVYPLSLYFIGLSLILMGSMRGWFLSTTDGALEMYYFNQIIIENIWHGLNLNGYNAMLSITVLPAILNIISNINPYYIIKLIFPIIFSFIFISIYVFASRYLNYFLAFLSTLFFIVQPNISGWTLFPPRQEIAFLFLSLTLLTLIDIKKISKKTKLLFLVFIFSTVVSHYSTTYALLACIFLYLFLSYIFNFISYTKKIDKKVMIPLFTISLFFIFTFLWYAQITTTYEGVVSVTKTSVSSFSEKLSEEGLAIFDPFNLFNKKPISTPQNNLDEFNQIYLNKSNNSNLGINLEEYKPIIKTTSQKPFGNNYFYWFKIFELSKIGFLLVGLLLVGFGLLAILFYKEDKFDIKFKLLSFIFLFFFVFVIAMPLSNSSYNINRLYQQQLLILCISSIIGFLFLSKFMNMKFSIPIFSLFLIGYLLIFTHVQYDIIGGREVQLRFANIGKDYDIHYTSSQEIISSNWLAKNKEPFIPILSDNYARFKNYQSEDFKLNTWIKMDVIPANIGINDYVYSSKSNKLHGITFKFYGGFLVYDFPNKFLNDNKNIIYSNGVSEIHK